MTERTAYHEAGHAFMAAYVGAEIRHVTICPDNDDGPQRHGDTEIGWDITQFTRQELHQRAIQVCLAGPVAEGIYRQEPFHPGFIAEWSTDWEQAWDHASHLIPDERKRLAYLEQVTRDLYRLLDRDEHWAAIAAVVDNLSAHERLEGEEVLDILNSWL